MVEEALRKIVQQIFTNWTGLRLAVEHSMGGPNSKQAAIDCVNEVTQYCLDDPNIDQESLEDFLEDVMDEKFDTIFEDGSPKEIAALLLRFVQLLKENNVQECDEEFSKLPVANTAWLEESKTSNQGKSQAQSDSSSDDAESTDVPMEDDGWTVVQTKKKR
ncbi:unnamed protein product [Phyllotreta striolata]|uniref:Pre-rRNA-processing protein TSR2 homolog n=1 Tax=Phyllotreta striolata TaxID=444603 RepID=A0A9N9TKD7_PHYSR|nr:unnamed protein product [Phyllotreta striolata]